MQWQSSGSEAGDYLELVGACNRRLDVAYRELRLEGKLIGYLRPQFAAELLAAADCVIEDGSGLQLDCRDTDPQSISQQLDEGVERLIARGVISHRHGERYGVYSGERERLLLTIDRAAAPYFGIRAYGQHLNGYLRRDGELWMWLGRRSLDRKHYPGALDNLAAGGLPHGISLADNLAKECWEEAGIPRELADQSVAVGSITYCCDTKKSRKPDTLYCYDLQLPEDFRPACQDGEVQEFLLLPMREVAQRILDRDAFKLNCTLVILDFMLRHGLLGNEYPRHDELLTGLHPALPGG